MHHPVSTTADRAAADGRVSFLLTLGRALHEAGHATHRLEELLEAVSRRLGIEGQFFATPTSIFASFGSYDRQRTFMMRTVPRPPDLGRLVRVSEVARAVYDGRIPPAEGSNRLAAVEAGSPPGAAPILAGYTLASAAAARFLGGSWPEIRVAALAGLLTGALALLAGRQPRVGRIFEPVAAFVAATVVALLGAWGGGHSVPIATLAGFIVLIPGLTVTTAIQELATQHLTAGTTRMAAAFMTFVGIGFGVALGYRVAALAGTAPPVTPEGLPDWTLWAALVAAALAFATLLRADTRDWPWIVASGFTAVLAARGGTAVLGSGVGAFVGAFAVSLFAGVYGRLADRPPAVVLVPGLLVLVPGSIGFRGVVALLESEVISGIDAGFTMILTAVALVAGLLTAAALVPERRLD
jgi:uncharacterized membrane protein YjjP (DUF1212 family)